MSWLADEEALKADLDFEAELAAASLTQLIASGHVSNWDGEDLEVSLAEFVNFTRNILDGGGRKGYFAEIADIG